MVSSDSNRLGEIFAFLGWTVGVYGIRVSFFELFKLQNDLVLEFLCFGGLLWIIFDAF